MRDYIEIHLIKRPDGSPVGPHMFKVINKVIPTPSDGEFLVMQTHMSMDPAMFGWMMPDEDSYIPPVPLDSIMRSSGVGKVVSSNHPDFLVGDTVMGMFGWTEYALTNGAGVSKISSQVDAETALAVFALPGITAMHGLFNNCAPKSGETLFVTGAAGSVGSLVGQLAKAEGLQVVGIVGDDEKAHWILEELGFDGAINYKTDDIAAKVAELAPNGIDIFFENTGGAAQQHIFNHMNAHGRITVCGMIADYTNAEPSPGPNWIPIITKRLKIQGFTMPDHLDQIPDLLSKLTPYVTSGQIKYRTHVLDGLKSAMTALNLFVTGQNKGKLIIRL